MKFKVTYIKEQLQASYVTDNIDYRAVLDKLYEGEWHEARLYYITSPMGKLTEVECGHVLNSKIGLAK